MNIIPSRHGADPSGDQGFAAAAKPRPRAVTVLSRGIPASLVSGMMLLATAGRRALAASDYNGPDPNDYVREAEAYLRQQVDWVEAGLVAVVHACRQHPDDIYRIGVSAAVIFLFVCGLVKAFFYGKRVAERMIGGREAQMTVLDSKPMGYRSLFQDQ